MSELSTLIERGWVTKQDPEFYEIKTYVRKNKEEISKIMERFGWIIQTEPNFVSVKKYHSINEKVANQGIRQFKMKQDYINLMVLLMFMSQPTHHTVFTLEEAMDYLKRVIQEEKIEADITSRQFSYSVYRTLTYMEEIHLVDRLDGKLNDLMEWNLKIPGILYKNTGMFQYYLQKRKMKEVAGTEQSVYQKLYGKTVTGIDKKEYAYLHKNAESIENDFSKIFDETVELVFEKDYAYINHREGMHFPNENNRKDWMLLRVLKKLKETETDVIIKDRMSKILEKVRNEDSVYWTQEMIRWGSKSYENFVKKELKKKNFIKEDREDIQIHPVVRNMDL